MAGEKTIFDSLESLSLEEEEINQIVNSKRYHIEMDTPLLTSVQLSIIIANALENGCFPTYRELQNFEEVQTERNRSVQQNQSTETNRAAIQTAETEDDNEDEACEKK